MNRTNWVTTAPVLGAFILAALGGCASKADPAAEAPPPAQVEHVGNVHIVQVDNPQLFPLATVVEHESAPELNATGAVSPDISRTGPVISLPSGRVVEVDARLGDTVKKGQVLLRVQSADIASAYSDYRKAVADEVLAHTQLDRATDLYGHGAISQNDLQVAQDAEAKAKVDVETSAEHLRVLGSPDLDHPQAVIDIRAPISGVITDQQVTNAAGVQGLSSPNPFTISDLSRVWILCDVYENDLPQIHIGEYADIRLNAYPDRVLKARIDNIGPILDPSIRTAKVRLEVPNPGLMHIGMFVTATFHGAKKVARAAVPASAILHLHDRDWVYLPAGEKKFQQQEVVAGSMLPNNMQEVVSGLKPGQQVVGNALELQNTVEQ
jgi:cobalt-zinc-cadmium efflux system membrane fusion protein